MKKSSYVVPPVTIDDAALTFTTVAEPDTGAGEVVYDVGHTYAFGDQAIDTTTHRVYRSRVDANIGKALPVSPATENDWWRDVGPTNQWALLDLLSTTPTVAASPLTIKLTSGKRITALGARGVVADGVTLALKIGGVEVWTKSLGLRRRVVRSWYQWTITPFDSTPDVAVLNIPAIIGGELTVTFTRVAGPVTVTQLLVGRQIVLGDPPKFDAVSDLEDYSRADRDDYGVLTLIPRRTVPKVSFNAVADRVIGRSLQDARGQLAGRPAMWLGLNDLTDAYGAALFMIGIYRRWVMTLGEDDTISQDFEIEGL